MESYRFILETNGILLGSRATCSRELSSFPSLHVRVSIKGCSDQEFTMLTGARPEGYRMQLDSLRNMKAAGVSCHPAVMVSFSTTRNLEGFKGRIQEMGQGLLADLEVEELILYPNVVKKLERWKLAYDLAYSPDEVPKRLV